MKDLLGSTYVVVCLRIILYLAIASFSECLMHLSVPRVYSVHRHGDRVHRLFHLGAPQSVPVFTSSTERLASILHYLILVLVDLHFILVDGAAVVLAVPDDNYKG